MLSQLVRKILVSPRRIAGKVLRQTKSPDWGRGYDEQERQWRAKNPDAPANGFYMARKVQTLASGKQHATLGGNLRDGDFHAAGKRVFERLLGFGLNENSVCVDYGSGTLRVGQHTLALVKPGNFWGFEIHEAFLEKSRILIGETAVRDKKPNLRVISPETVCEAATFKPDFLYSCNVMQKVNPDMLDEYLGNIATLIGSWGRAHIFNTKWHGSETVRYGSSAWAHDINRIREFCAGRGLEVTVMYSTELERGPGVKVIAGGLRLHPRPQ